MAGKVNGRKSKARLSDAIKVNGETEGSDDLGPTEIMEQSVDKNDVAAKSEEDSTSNAESEVLAPSEVFSNIKSPTRSPRASKRKAEDTHSEEDLVNESINEPNESIRKSTRVRRPKKAKTDSTDNKDEPAVEETTPMELLPPKFEMISDRPASQMSFKSEDESAGSPAPGKGGKPKVDLSNPLFKEPMLLGWKRELVFRATVDSKSNKRQADVYYYAPNGKKLRSTREVKDNLSDGLTVENFTFAKEAIGLNDPEQEIIRDAKITKSRISTGGESPIAVSSLSSSFGSKRTPKPKLPKGASPPPFETLKSTPKTTPKSGFKVKLTNARLGATPKKSPLKTIKSEKKVVITEKPDKSTKIDKVEVKVEKEIKKESEDVKSKLKGKPKETKGMQMGMLPPSAAGNKRLKLKNNTVDEESLSPKRRSIKRDIVESPKLPSPGKLSKVSKQVAHVKPNDTKQLPKGKKVPVSPPAIPTDDDILPFYKNFCKNMSNGYYALLQIFQYLKVQELLRTSRVCRMWNELSGHQSLWKTVRMKNSQVGDWAGLARSLQKHKTKHLDLRKMLIPSATDIDDMWKQFSDNIGVADSLDSIDFCRCPAEVVEKLCASNPKIQIINAVTIKCDKISLEPFSSLKFLQELRLKSSGGFIIKDLRPLKELMSLKHLSMTSVKELGKIGCEVIGELVDLQSLEVGDCSDFPPNFGTEVLIKLQLLERLRLEKGQGNCCTFNLLECVSKLPVITQLELVNFDIKAGFDKSLAACSNIKRLLIIPTYISQSATTNHMVLGGVIKLTSSLSQFVWGVTLELLRVTELFVDQCEGPKKDKKPTCESIPVLKPVPSLVPSDTPSEAPTGTSTDVPQVEILPLPSLQKLLNGALPLTRVRILKIPFHATWRQSISDTQ